MWWRTSPCLDSSGHLEKAPLLFMEWFGLEETWKLLFPPGRLSLGDCFIVNIPGGCYFRCSQQDIGLFSCDPGLRAVAAPRSCLFLSPNMLRGTIWWTLINADLLDCLILKVYLQTGWGALSWWTLINADLLDCFIPKVCASGRYLQSIPHLFIPGNSWKVFPLPTEGSFQSIPERFGV